MGLASHKRPKIVIFVKVYKFMLTMKTVDNEVSDKNVKIFLNLYNKNLTLRVGLINLRA